MIHADYPPVNEFVVKLASRCNINCTYCYWFNDPKVMESPKLLSIARQNSFVEKLKNHIKSYSLVSISVAFHGGEPTLFPLERFESFCRDLKNISQNCQIHLSIQTNALLIDRRWIKVLKQYDVAVGISLDGSAMLHDKYRLDHKGRGTYDKTVAKISEIQAHKLPIYILTVANPQTKPQALLSHFVNDLGLLDFDILLPHIYHDMPKVSYTEYLISLFDCYIDEWIEKGANIRLLDDLMCQLLGGTSSTQGLGYISTVALLTDGRLEGTDDLRMAKTNEKSCINISTNALQEVTQNPMWQETYRASLNLHANCRTCTNKVICGGGPLVSRWSNDKGFNNPSSYCDAYTGLITHMRKRLQPSIERLVNNTNDAHLSLLDSADFIQVKPIEA